MKKIIAYIFLIFSVSILSAQEFPSKGNTMVNDYAHMLSNREAQNLEAKLVQFNRETSNQIAVVTLDDLHGYDPNDYAQRLAEQWGIGQQGKNNGILILVKPKTVSSRGQAAISVGYGLEGSVPDAIAFQIVQKELIPHFKQNDISGGLNAASDVLISLTKGEFTAEQYASKGGSGGKPVGVLLLVFMVFIIRILISGGRRRHYTMGRGSSALPWILMGGMMGRSSGSSFSNFSNGSGSFGGGGFGGFGGGSFGGGGASGSW